jgi:omega-6 fatty acid desaturase (delta-12 desaturase)
MVTKEIEIEKEIKTKLANWKKIISEYQVPNTKIAIRQLLNSFLPYVTLWIVMYFTIDISLGLTLTIASLNSFFLVRIFIIQHDCGHQSFTKSKKANNIIGTCCSFFSSIPYKYWAKIHNHHHGHTGQLEERDIGDINFLTVEEFRAKNKWGRLKYRFFRHPLTLFIVVPIFYFTISNRLPMIKDFRGMVNRIKLSQLKNNLAILAVYGALAYLIGIKHFLIIQLSIICFFSVIAFWFFYVQHTHETSYHSWRENWDFLIASIRGSSYYKLPKIFQWLTGNIGIHHIHHLSSRIPNYNLARCAQEHPIFNKYANILTFSDSLKCINKKLWDEQLNRMISFKEFYQQEKMRLA